MAVIYSDINTAYTKNNLSVNITDIKDIVMSLERLFNTVPGDCPFNREYGSNLYYLLFESSQKLDFTDIKVLLTKDIERWEPRVNLNPLNISIEKEDEHSFVVQCIFTVPALDNAEGTLVTKLTDK